MRLVLALLLTAAACGDASDGGDTDAGGGDASNNGNDASGADGASDGSSGGQPLTPGDSTLTLTVDGQTRSAILHVPAHAQPMPLVIALHGNGDTNTNFVASLGLATKADQDGFVLVAPQGITQSFTFMGTPVNGVDWDAYRPNDGTNIDLPLIDQLRAKLSASGSIDVKRIWLFGYSQGGYLSFRAGMDFSAALACTVVAAASNPLPGSPLVSSAARKIPVAMQIGTNDFGINNARSTQTELTNNGNPLLYNEIQGAGHVPFPGDPAVPLDWCRMKSLP